ncbi:MAG: TrmH family RNA methyltransferase [Sphingobacteriaceae bacterium]
MLSKSQISFIKSLHQKKYRKEEGLFLVEGLKSVLEFIDSAYQIHSIYCTSDIVPKLGKISHNIKLEEVKPEELAKISALNTPQDILALVNIPEQQFLKPNSLKGLFALVLDGIQDPGNMGTIIRTADWFGIQHIICSNDTVEVYNPKVVQASMGSIARVQTVYTDLVVFLSESTLPAFAATLGGKSIYETDFKSEGLIILGNEGNGIRKEILEKAKKHVTIPRFGSTESLNVAVSAGIFCSAIRMGTAKA